MFKDSRVWSHPTATLLADSGYQGIVKIHPHSHIPVKNKPQQELAVADKNYHRQLASLRGSIEHLNRRGKIFRVVKAVYRGKHQHYSTTWGRD